MKKIRIYIICFVFSLIASFIFSNEKLTFAVDGPVINLFKKYSFKNNADSNVLMLNFDENDFKKYGQWPWKRQTLSKIIDAISKNEPRGIGLAILLPSSSDDAGDKALNLSICKSRNVVEVFIASNTIYPFNYSEKKSEVNKFSIGYVDYLIYDAYKRIIGQYPRLEKNGDIQSSFSLKLAEFFSATKSHSNLFSNEMIWTNYYGPKGTFKAINLNDIFKYNLKGIVRDKIIIVGVDFPPAYVSTPFGEMNMTEAQANLVQNFIDGNWLRLNFYLNFIIVLIFSFFYCFFLINEKWKYAFGSSFLFYIVSSYAMLLHGIIISFSSVIFVWVVVSIFLFIFKKVVD